METSEIKSNWEAPTWMWLLLIFVLVASFAYWGWYEENAGISPSIGRVIPHKDLCPCEKPKARIAHNKPKPKQKPAQQAKTKPPFVVDEVIAGWRATPKAVAVDTTQKVEIKPVLDTVDPDYGKTEVVFTPLPEKEVEPPRVGRKILVIRQQPMMPYYSGYNPGYSQPYAPQVTYGQPYIPPPQTVFVPAPPVIVPAPSVVTPAGGYKPGYTTKPAGPGYVTNQAL